MCFCLLYTSFSGKHKTSYCPKVVRDRIDVVWLELYVGDSLKNVGDFLKNVGVFWKTLGDFFWTWEIFSYERESQKNRLERMESETPSRAWRAHALQRFLFFHFHNLHTTDDFGRKITWKGTSKGYVSIRKLTPYFAGRWWRLWKQKINLQGKARVTRAREKLVLIFLHPTSKNDRKVKIAL